MKKTLTYKILEKHLIKGDLAFNNEICIKVNQTLSQDSTGTMVYLQLNAMNIDSVATDLSVAYIDHNMLQSSFENADDHDFIKTSALKHNIIFSKPGNGICHQLHLENFAKPGDILIGSDSHTPTAGGLGTLAIGAGGLDVAIGMAKGYYYITVPKIMNIILEGNLQPWVNAKDIILEILRQLSVTGGVGYIIEYTGSGVKHLSIEQRATITNMGAELGATTSLFESDEITRAFLKKQGREQDYIELSADEQAKYDKTIKIDLNKLEPLIAFPHSPDNVHTIPQEQIKVNQVIIGSCTNSSYSDMVLLAKILKDHKVHEDVSLAISIGSSKVMNQLANEGYLSQFIKAGARILESACGPCIGMGQAPKSNGVSLRTFNRNFKGRSGTMNADIYLSSVETAAISAIKGYIASPLTIDIEFENIELPEQYPENKNYFIFPKATQEERKKIEISYGPNIKPVPQPDSFTDSIRKHVILKAGDNITTDDICPSNAQLLPYRSNIPYLAKYCFSTIIPDLEKRAHYNNGGIIIAGKNYGQGSSREHAAMLLVQLKIKVVVAKSFARIHKANLINNGILPLEFVNETDYNKINEYDILSIIDLEKVTFQNNIVTIKNDTKKETYYAKLHISKRQLDVLKAGGYLNYALKEVL